MSELNHQSAACSTIQGRYDISFLILLGHIPSELGLARQIASYKTLIVLRTKRTAICSNLLSARSLALINLDQDKEET